MNTLNNLPAMSAGVYSRFSITLYQLVKRYYGDIDVKIVTTAQNIAVLSINDFIINPYLGITLCDLPNTEFSKGLDYFLEVDLPEGEEVMAFLKEFADLLENSRKYIPLTVENVYRLQSRFHTESLALDIYSESKKVHPRNGTFVYKWCDRTKRHAPLPNILYPDEDNSVFQTKFYYPRNSEFSYNVELVRCSDSLEVEIIDTEGNKPVAPLDIFEEFEPATHFLPGEKTPEGFYKPGCSTEIPRDDFFAGGIFADKRDVKLISYKVFSKRKTPILITPENPVFTMLLKIDGMTVHPMTEQDESSFNFPLPLQK